MAFQDRHYYRDGGGTTLFVAQKLSFVRVPPFLVVRSAEA